MVACAGRGVVLGSRSRETPSGVALLRRVFRTLHGRRRNPVEAGARARQPKEPGERGYQALGYCPVGLHFLVMLLVAPAVAGLDVGRFQWSPIGGTFVAPRGGPPSSRLSPGVLGNHGESLFRRYGPDPEGQGSPGGHRELRGTRFCAVKNDLRERCLKKIASRAPDDETSTPVFVMIATVR